MSVKAVRESLIGHKEVATEKLRTVFESLTVQHKLAALGAAVAIAAVGGTSIYTHMRSNAALEGISQKLRLANADRVPEAKLLGASASFKNAMTGTPGRFELMGRNEVGNGRKCYHIAITDGDYSGASHTIQDSAGRKLKVPVAALVCP